MSHGNDPEACKRPGCLFQRSYIQARDGGYRRQRHCSKQCYVWCRRATHVAREGTEEEAAELLRLSDLLDARKTPGTYVPGVLNRDEAHY